MWLFICKQSVILSTVCSLLINVSCFGKLDYLAGSFQTNVLKMSPCHFLGPPKAAHVQSKTKTRDYSKPATHKHYTVKGQCVLQN